MNDDETGPSQTAKLLGREFNVRVLNAGVRGYSTLQSARTMAECFERFPGIVAVVYTFCANDLEENMVPNLRFPAKCPVVVREPSTGKQTVREVTLPTVDWGESFTQRQWNLPRPSRTSRWGESLACRSAWFTAAWRVGDRSTAGGFGRPRCRTATARRGRRSSLLARLGRGPRRSGKFCGR